MNHFIEIRSYNVEPGSRDEFQRLFLDEALPLLVRWNADGVAYDPSLHDENSCFLIRRFDSLAHREQSENDFYRSVEWHQGPSEAILAVIENYAEIVLMLEKIPYKACESQNPNIRAISCTFRTMLGSHKTLDYPF